MDYWDELGIAPTSEKRDIKRAYAKLLKTTKPDDNPEGFKALNAAYQAALNLAPYVNLDDEPSREHEHSMIPEALLALQAEGSSVVTLEGEDSIVDHDLALHAEHADQLNHHDGFEVNRDGKDDEIVASETPHQDIGESTDSDAPEPWLAEPEAGKTNNETISGSQSKPPLTYQQLIYETQWLTKSRARNNSQRWEALLSEDVLIDWEAFEAYSQFLFTYVSSCFVEKNRYKLSARMLRYLNDHFNWSNRVDWLESFATDEAIHVFQKILNQPPLLSGFFLPKVQQYRYWQLAPEADISGARFLNGFFLAVAFIITLKLLSDFIKAPDWIIFRATIGITLLIAFIIMPCLEGTRARGSLGYRWQGICLLRADGKTVTYWHCVLRFLLNIAWVPCAIIIFLIAGKLENALGLEASNKIILTIPVAGMFYLVFLLRRWLRDKLNIIIVSVNSLVQ